MYIVNVLTGCEFSVQCTIYCIYVYYTMYIVNVLTGCEFSVQCTI